MTVTISEPPVAGEPGSLESSGRWRGLGSRDWRAAVDAVTDGIWILDRERRVVYSNGVAERLLGIDLSSVVGLPCRATAVCRLKGWNDDCLLDRMDFAGAPVTREVTLGAEGWTLLVTASPIRGRGGDVTGAIYVIRDVSEQRRAETQARELAASRRDLESRVARLADHDTLTSLPKRELFAQRLSQAIGQASLAGRAVAVLVVDVDRFHAINEALGPGTGDEALRVVATALSGAVRGRDTLARLGNDEFGVILADMNRPEDVTRVAEKVARVFADPLRVGVHDLLPTVSAGVATFPTDAGDGPELLRRAGVALSRAKEAGSCSWRFYSRDMDERASEAVALAPRLRRAVERREFLAYFQPYFDVVSGRLAGMEALLRWKSAEQGLVMPDKFIPVLEQTGLILDAGDQVIGQVCARLAGWRSAGRSIVPVAVNLSAAQFRDERLADVIRRAAADSRVEPGMLVFEITESTFMQDVTVTRRILETLKQMGAAIAIDDFGTGYSSLSYLKKFPVDFLKIDRAFIREIETDSDDAALVTAMISLAHSLGIKTIAEGVETEAQLRILGRLGCDAVQGYFFARPMPPEDEDRLFAAGTRGA